MNALRASSPDFSSIERSTPTSTSRSKRNVRPSNTITSASTGSLAVGGGVDTERASDRCCISATTAWLPALRCNAATLMGLKARASGALGAGAAAGSASGPTVRGANIWRTTKPRCGLFPARRE